MAYWGEYPPTHLLVRAYMGYGSDKGRTSAGRACDVRRIDEGGDIGGLLTALGGMGG